MRSFAARSHTPQANRNTPSPLGVDAEVLSKDLAVETNSLAQLLGQCLRLPTSIIVSSLAINLLGLALPLVVLQIFDRVLQHNSLSTLALLIAGLFCVISAEIALRFARNQLIGRTALCEGFDLQMRGATKFLNAPRSTASSITADRAFDAMTAMDEMNQFLGGQGRLALLDFPFIFLFLGIIGAIGGLVVVMPVLLIVVFSAWTIWSSVNYKRALKAQVELDHDRYAFYTECLKGIATVKALAIEPQMQRRLERLMRFSAPVNYDLVLRANRIMASGQLFANLTMMSVVSVGGILAINDTITVGAVAACTLIANRVTQPVLRIIGIWGQMEAAQFARERYAPLMALPPAPRTPRRPGAAAIQVFGLQLGDGPDILQQRGIDLTIEPGQVIGIVDGEYAQRGELLSILRGRSQPRGGSVVMDGIDVAGPEGQAVYQDVFFLGTEPVIFRGSILDNISMFRRVSQVSAMAVARQLGLEPVIQVLPEGYDTSLSDVSAAALPMDVLQAICIARAVVMKPRLLLLRMRRIPPDDVSTRACIRAIEQLRGNTTIIIFGDVMQEVEDADRIFLFEPHRLNEIERRKGGATGQVAGDVSPRDRKAESGG